MDCDKNIVKLVKFYIIEKVLLCRSENCVVSNYLMKIININKLRYLYPWVTLGFIWLVCSLRKYLQLFKEESNNQDSYYVSQFPFVLNVWVSEVFLVFQEYAKLKSQIFSGMLCWYI